MKNIQYEYSRDLPEEAAGLLFTDGEPILYAYECVLLERDTGERFIYTAANLKTGGKEVLARRLNPLTTSEVGKMVERIRLSKVAGAKWVQADRPVKNYIGGTKAREILTSIFRFVLPQNGYAIREEQINLANGIMDAIEKKSAAVFEAQTGTGKTEGYLIPAVVAKRGRLNDSKNLNLYPGMQYADMARIPIVIATSSIALQRAIMTEYIPRLSQIFLESGVIKKPLTAVLRKGKEHYVCERNLRKHPPFESNNETRLVLESLLLPDSTIDLAETDINRNVKRKICVNGRCSEICQYKESCSYLVFRDDAQSSEIDIQVCNHNYLLADTLLRANKQHPLIPNYQTLIIDEAHKFIDAARTMYGTELSSVSAHDVLNNIGRLSFKREGFQELAHQAGSKLVSESDRLFIGLCATADSADDDADTKSVAIDTEETRHIRNMQAIAERLLFILRHEAFFCKAVELLGWVSRKYNIDTSGINLKKLLTGIGNENDNSETMREIMRYQIVKLHQAILNLPEIQRKSQLERQQRQARRLMSQTEQQAYFNDKSKISEVIWKKARRLLPVESASGNESDWVVKLIWQIQHLLDQATEFANHKQLICWLETEDDKPKLCAIPNNLNERLFRDQWSKGIPTILTSGTLSAGGDFTRTNQTLGLDLLGKRLTEATYPSPFDFKKNALLYLSEKTPFPNGRDKKYINAITDEVERLVLASHGRAAVLFTSYDTMGRVYAAMTQRNLPFPLFRLDKGGIKEINRFKQSKGGVLFASGALWEGIDIPGDALSMLIIVKLPFQVPDAIGEYERKQYPNFPSYLKNVLVPEMLVKLKQGFGRLIRTETDSGVVAILDCRVNGRGSYRERVLNALPDCRVTDDIGDVEAFMRMMKTQEYFT